MGTAIVCPASGIVSSSTSRPVDRNFKSANFKTLEKIDPLFQIEFNRRRIADYAESRFNGFSIIEMLIIGDPLCNRVNQNSCPILISVPPKLALILIHLIFAILNLSPPPWKTIQF